MSTNIRWFPLVLGILFIAGSIFMFANPALQLAALGFFFSLLIFGSGVVSLINYFAIPASLRSGWDLVNAIITILLGMLLMTNSGAEQAALIPTIVGIWLIVDGIIRLMIGQRAKYVSYAFGSRMQWTAFLPIIFGILLVIFPVFFGSVGVWLVALGFLAFGIFNIALFIASLRAPKQQSNTSEIIDL